MIGKKVSFEGWLFVGNGCFDFTPNSWEGYSLLKRLTTKRGIVFEKFLEKNFPPILTGEKTLFDFEERLKEQKFRVTIERIG